MLRFKLINITLHINKLLLFILMFACADGFAQAPNISYHTPQKYTVNTIILPLAPTNTGGAVPATPYGQVTTFAGSGFAGLVNGTGTGASFTTPNSTKPDPSGNIYVADVLVNVIRNNHCRRCEYFCRKW